MKSNRSRTKIVATLGPVSASPARIEALLRAGVDVFRINFSHGTHAELGVWIDRVRLAALRLGVACGILADLQGPRIRLGRFQDGDPFHLKKGDGLTLVADPRFIGGPGRVGCSYRRLALDLEPREQILIDDGRIELVVQRIGRGEVHTRVVAGGLLRERKGLNLPGTKISATSLSGKDRLDLELALHKGVEFVALSFVRGPRDVVDLKRRILRSGSSAAVIAKIERLEAVSSIEAIVEVADAVMVARGDLGVELGVHAVPALQKRIIRICREHRKPVITATQMMESMVEEPQPTRAEASDIANAIHDGTSALMLSAETAIGRYPLEAVRMMNRIALETEEELWLAMQSEGVPLLKSPAAASVLSATVSAAARAAALVGARAIVVFTETGRTARHLSSDRLPVDLVAFTPHEDVRRRMSLLWGIHALSIPRARDLAHLHRLAEASLLRLRLARPGDRVVFIAGTFEVSGATNTMLIKQIGSRPGSARKGLQGPVSK